MKEEDDNESLALGKYFYININMLFSVIRSDINECNILVLQFDQICAIWASSIISEPNEIEQIAAAIVIQRCFRQHVADQHGKIKYINIKYNIFICK